METYLEALGKIEEAVKALPFTEEEKQLFLVYISRIRKAIESWDAPT